MKAFLAWPIEGDWPHLWIDGLPTAMPTELRVMPGLYWHRITETAGRKFWATMCTQSLQVMTRLQVLH